VLNPGRLAQQLASSGIAVTVVDETRTSSLAILRYLASLMRELRPDIVHTHRRKENVLGGMAARLAGIPSIRTIHGAAETVEPWFRLDKLAYGMLDRWTRRALQAAAIAVSPELLERTGQEHLARKTFVIRNGISADRVRAAAPIEPSLPDAGDRVRLAFAGRLVQVKRVDRLLEALRIVLDQRRDAYVLYILGDGPERDSLTRLASRLGVQDHAHFLGNRTDALACLSRMDMLLLASEHEGLPMVVLEALCLGLFPVVPPVGGLPELIREAGFGRITKSASAMHLAEAVLEWHPTRGARDASSRLPGKWTIEASVQAHVELYRALLAGHPRGPVSVMDAAA
jgi:glycosyltransferase involved in cell wall biosynthesis